MPGKVVFNNKWIQNILCVKDYSGKGIALYMPVVLLTCLGCVDKMNYEYPLSTDLGCETELAANYAADLALNWYDLELKWIRQKPGFAPPVAARTLGYTGVILYESLIPAMPRYQSLANVLQIPGLPDVNAPQYHCIIAANASLAFALRHFTGNLSDDNLHEIDSMEKYFNNQFQVHVSKEQFLYSVTYGKEVASAIYEWSKVDGGHDGYVNNYKSALSGPLDPGKWVATTYAGALLPDWGNNRPFMEDNVSQCQPPPPPVYSDEEKSILYREAYNVYSVFNLLTSDQAETAKYWADPPGSTFTPAGHSIQILCQIIRSENLPLDSAAIAFAKLGIALNDAFISCWKAKYQYNYIRPITYIRKNIRKDWLPFIQTPSFPEYPSGHSVQSAAAAEVLSSIFGDIYSFTDNSNDTLGYEPRTYFSFEEYAHEAAVSRMYGGIHFQFSVENGLLQGKKIGKNVNALNYFMP